MTKPVNQEQELCVTCGLCCDGTLFKHALSFEGEKLLPYMIPFQDDKGDHWFKLPCPHFKQCCTVYEQKRPKICGSFKCQLLNDLNKQKISFADAHSSVGNIKRQISRLHSLIPNYDKKFTLQENFLNFQKKHKSTWNTKKFRLKYKEVLMEYALFKLRIAIFYKRTKEK